MRLAFTTIAIMAVFAGAFTYWQESTAAEAQTRRSISTQLR